MTSQWCRIRSSQDWRAQIQILAQVLGTVSNHLENFKLSKILVLRVLKHSLRKSGSTTKLLFSTSCFISGKKLYTRLVYRMFHSGQLTQLAIQVMNCSFSEVSAMTSSWITQSLNWISTTEKLSISSLILMISSRAFNGLKHELEINSKIS